jgi:catechol 2,3-dioxygenase-like lactoylglutathione lyase family enzyme
VSLIPELSVTDFQKSLEFYVSVLGFSVLYERPEEGFAMLKLGDAQLMIDQIGLSRDWITAPPENPFGRGTSFQIEVENLELMLENLKHSNISLSLPVEEKWYRSGQLELGNRQFLVQDPDGYLLRFFQSLGQRELGKGTS